LFYRLYRVAAAVLWMVAGWVLRLRALRRAPWAERLGKLPTMPPGSIWVHAASVGEVSAALPLVRLLREAGEAVVFTVVTPAGRDVARRSVPGGVEVAHVPLDFVRPVRTALARVRPRALLLVETELWPNLIVEARSAGAIVGVVNGRLSEASARRYRAVGSPLGGVLGAIAFILCQSEQDRRRFVDAGFPEAGVHVVGNTKFDTLDGPLPEGRRAAVAESLGIPLRARVVVFGSVRPREEEHVARAVASIEAGFPGVWQVVAPRHLDRVEPLRRRLDAIGVASARRSASSARPSGCRVVVLDTTGELSSVYSIAAVAFVGGTLAAYGGHNPLEPAAQGVPVVLGAHTESCRESAGALVEGGGAVTVRSGGELFEAIAGLLRDDGRRAEAAAAALRVVDGRRGATGRTLRLLEAEGVLGGDAG